jgi:hypothetical protein
MNDLAISVIRTVVPTIVGAVLAFFASKGIELDASAAANLTGFLTAVFSGVYYVIVRLLEAKYPKAGILLGKAKTPEY